MRVSSGSSTTTICCLVLAAHARGPNAAGPQLSDATGCSWGGLDGVGL